jgi:predicted dehydrogenase
MKSEKFTTTRRQFIKGTAAAATAFAILPTSRTRLHGATPANQKLNIACIGVGGRGRDNIQGVRSENIIALCDVDSNHAAQTFAQFPAAKKFQDFRRMFDQMETEIDAVMISTPDHTHAVAVNHALKLGKPVFCEKPLAHSIHEIRSILHAARQAKVPTQLGNQGHASDSIRTFCEWIWAGAIGPVREVHAFCQSSYSRIADLEKLEEKHPVPGSLDWDLWVGPAPLRPYHPLYLPGKWRAWSNFGTGVIGDWTCHILDPVFWALDLGAPSSIRGRTFNFDPQKHSETFPPSNIIEFEFAAKENRAPLKISWFDGAQRPPRPEELPEGENLPGIGAVVIGDKGKIIYGSHGAGGLKLFPAERREEFVLPEKTIPRVPGIYQEWVQACKTGDQPSSNFEYGGPLTELALLGVIALRIPEEKLAWNGTQFTSSREANGMLQREYRPGWNL